MTAHGGEKALACGLLFWSLNLQVSQRLASFRGKGVMASPPRECTCPSRWQREARRGLVGCFGPDASDLVGSAVAGASEEVLRLPDFVDNLARSMNGQRIGAYQIGVL